MTDEEICKQLIDLAKTEEQIRYLTRESDVVKDTKIATYQRDLGELQRRADDARAAQRTAEEMLDRFIDKLLKKATTYESDCC
jgi:hypothetical protein